MTDEPSTFPVEIAAFYHFQAIAEEQVSSLSTHIEAEGRLRGLRGLIILAVEGINGTICGELSALQSYLTWLAETLKFPPFTPKMSQSASWPFHRFKVRVRNEIVTLGKPDVQPLEPFSSTHLSPEKWDEMMEADDVVVIDTRNWYETRIGKFKGAVDPGLSEFHDFPKFLSEAKFSPDKKFLIYCTGGIRCEKALVEMVDQGLPNVYQLQGGILNYLAYKSEQKAEPKFEGECFVFDHRVAVDQKLEPTLQYKLCPHCGQPADQKLLCVRCDEPTLICVTCAVTEAKKTCSKNCAYHFRMRPGAKGRSQRLGLRFQPAESDAHHTLATKK